MKSRKICALALTAILTVSVFAGCTKKPNTSNSSMTPSSASEQTSSEAPKKATSGQLETAYEAAVKSAFGEEAPSLSLSEDAAQLKEMTGIDVTNEAVKEFLYSAPMINVQFQIFCGIEAKEGKVADVEKMLKDYQAKVIKDKEEFAYVDFGLEKAKGAQVITVDDYVFYICFADMSTLDEATQEDVNAKIQKTVDDVKASLKTE